MPAVHIHRDITRAAERQGELDVLVSPCLASPRRRSVGRRFFVPESKVTRPFKMRTQKHLVHTRAFLHIRQFFFVVLFVMFDWPNEFTLKFLELYQNEPVIWDLMHLYQKDRKQINDAWVRLNGQLKFSVTELKKKKIRSWLHLEVICVKKKSFDQIRSRCK
jgi:hypothetical protein